MKNKSVKIHRVCNKDILLITHIPMLMEEINEIEKRREWQQQRLYIIKAQRMTGMPGGGGRPRGLDEGFAALSELDYEHNRLIKSYVREVKRAWKVIDDIESATMRAFVKMKYMSNYPDTKIRSKLNMSRRGFERAKECIESAPCMAAVKWHERYIMDDSE